MHGSNSSTGSNCADGIMWIPSRSGFLFNGECVDHRYSWSVSVVPLKMKRRGVETRIIIMRAPDNAQVDFALLEALSACEVWFDELASGWVHSLDEIARNEGIASAAAAYPLVARSIESHKSWIGV